MVHAIDSRICLEEEIMKILLIRPRPHQETIGLQSVMVCEPLELMQLSAVLKANGHDVRILDMILEKRPLASYIGDFAPELVGLTGYISHIGVIKSYARMIKRCDKNIVVAIGGVHATVCPDDFIDESIDHVCRSAREFYLLAGCDDLKERFADRTLPKRYTAKYYYLFADHCALIKTSFGCPYNCNFCFCKEITPYHARNIAECVEELLLIEQRNVYIVDDDFLFNKERLHQFCALLKENNIDKRFLVYGRADFISANEEIIKELAQAGPGGGDCGNRGGFARRTG